MIKLYCKVKGKLTKINVDGIGKDIKGDLQAYGLESLRALAGADKDSPVMVIVK